ncbi:MAG: WD40 repeat domain-containing serine/threonine-protein kinase, partial [Cyanobacteria bacterium P01_E01_bin.43]
VPASDLYSLGLTCLYLLTGVHPFDLYSVAEDRWVWQTLTPVPVRDALARVLNRLTARALRSRYSTATAALADLAPAGLIPQRRVTSNLVKRPSNPWRCTQIWPTSGRVVNALAIAPTGQAIAAANSDGTVQLWDYQTGEVLHTFAQRLGLGEGHRDAATAVTFHPDGQTLFSASQDGTVKQWNLDRYRQRQSLQQPGWQVTTIALTPDGAQLIAAETTGRISLWQVDAGKRLVDLTRHSGAVNQVQVSSQGDRLVSVGEAGTLRLWALPTGQLLHTWTVQTGLRVVALNEMVPAVVTGDRRGAVMLWSLTDFDQHQQLGQHQDAVSAIALSPNGRWLATGSRDREIHLWDWGGEIPQRCAVLRHDWAVCDLVFTPDSQTLISSAADETIRFWQAVADG